MAQAAFRFILSNPGVTCAIGGFSSVEQMEEIVAISGSDPFPSDLVARLENVWRSNFDMNN
jgi:aryl-alcohol dehydrogenase-like predicted oxidoreductase